MKKNLSYNKGPFVQMISFALKNWIKSRSNKLEEIRVQINGSIIEMLRGELKGIYMSAKRINFNDIIINRCELKADDLEFSLEIRDKIPNISFKRIFNISGFLCINSKDINLFMKNIKWSWIINLICDEIDDSTILETISLEEEYFKVITLSSNQHRNINLFRVKANKGSIEFIDQKKNRKVLIPMDPLINIEKVYIKDDDLFLEGNSIIKP